ALRSGLCDVGGPGVRELVGRNSSASNRIVKEPHIAGLRGPGAECGCTHQGLDVFAVPSPQNRFVIKKAPCESNARREVGFLGISERRRVTNRLGSDDRRGVDRCRKTRIDSAQRTGTGDDHRSAYSLAVYGASVIEINIGHVVVLVTERRMVL